MELLLSELIRGWIHSDNTKRESRTKKTAMMGKLIMLPPLLAMDQRAMSTTGSSRAFVGIEWGADGYMRFKRIVNQCLIASIASNYKLGAKKKEIRQYNAD